MSAIHFELSIPELFRIMTRYLDDANEKTQVRIFEILFLILKDFRKDLKKVEK